MKRLGDLREFVIRGTLYFVVESINHETDVFRKAAQALFSADRHPFWDGRKRTAFVLADSILREHGYYFDKSDKAGVMSVLKRIAEYRCPEGGEIDTIARWVKRKAQKATS